MFKEKKGMALKVKNHREQIKMVWKLSIPAVMAQITSIIMQYIDAGMVGSLGADASAAIGLVSTSTWLLGGLCTVVSTGFSVQVAQFIGAGKKEKARQVVYHAFLYAILFSVLLAVAGASISSWLPAWLGGEAELRKNASAYFLIYASFIPALQLNSLAGMLLQCSGNMKTPGILNSCMCFLDIVLNAVLIFPSGQIALGTVTIPYYGMNLGVAGAALGTALAELIICCFMVFALIVRSPVLHLERKMLHWKRDINIVKRAIKIGAPMALEHVALCGAMVATTRIVAPLGTIAIAANSFGITVESLCYMPGYGIASAATTLVGQSFGAKDTELANKYAWTATINGVLVMTVTGALMFIFAPVLMRILTPDAQVLKLGVEVLRIEAFAEPLYAASIVVSGALRGAGDTLVPSIINLCSIWGVRLSLAVVLVSHYGLHGVWVAMCVELCVRGILLLIRLKRGRWLKVKEA